MALNFGGEKMNELIKKADGLLKNGGFEYAFCGGHAVDLFLGYESRVHGDIDVTMICVKSQQISLLIKFRIP